MGPQAGLQAKIANFALHNPQSLDNAVFLVRILPGKRVDARFKICRQVIVHVIQSHGPVNDVGPFVHGAERDIAK